MFRPGKGYTPPAKQPAAPGGCRPWVVSFCLPVLESERLEPSTAEERTGPLSACTGGIRIGVPVGMELLGRAWAEPELTKLAFGFEQARTCESHQFPRLHGRRHDATALRPKTNCSA